MCAFAFAYGISYSKYFVIFVHLPVVSNLIRSFKVKSIFGCHIFTEHATMLEPCFDVNMNESSYKLYARLNNGSKQSTEHRLPWANIHTHTHRQTQNNKHQKAKPNAIVVFSLCPVLFFPSDKSQPNRPFSFFSLLVVPMVWLWKKKNIFHI